MSFIEAFAAVLFIVPMIGFFIWVAWLALSR